MALLSVSKNVAAVVIISLLLIVPRSITAVPPAKVGKYSRFHQRQEETSSARDKSRTSNRGMRVRTRKMVRGEPWVAQSHRGPEVQNIFVHRMSASEDCDCLNPDIGDTEDQTPCTCGNENSSDDTSNQSGTPQNSVPVETLNQSSQPPGNSTVATSNQSSQPQRQPINNHPSAAPSVGSRHSSYYGSKSSYYSKSSKGTKGKGKGVSSNDRGDDQVGELYDDYYDSNQNYYVDDYYISSKQEKDGKKSSKKQKSHKDYGKGYGKGYSYDDDYIYPTRSPIGPPAVPSLTPTRVPTVMTPTSQPQTISPDIGREDTPKPTAQPTLPPTPGPTGRTQAPKPPSTKCSVTPEGLYGQDIGLATEIRFIYLAQIIPTVEVPEITMDILPKVEVHMGNDLLQYLFPNECSELSKRMVGNDKMKRNTYLGDRNRNRKRRQLQSPLSLNGLSIKPRDTLDETAVCDSTTLSDGFPCFVIKGRVTVFSTAKLDSMNMFQLENTITKVIDGNLNDADNRLLAIIFKEFDDSPPPKESTNWFFDTAWWILVLIALGVVLLLVVLLVCCSRCCRRRRQLRPIASAQRPDANQGGVDKGRRKSKKSNSNSSRKSSRSRNSSSRDSSSSNSSSIETNENLSVGDAGVGPGRVPGSSAASGPSSAMVDDPKSSEYNYHSADHINQSLLPDRAEPIVEERQEDFSSGEYPRKPILRKEYDNAASYKPSKADSYRRSNSDDKYNGAGVSFTEVTVDGDDQYDGVSYEDRIYQNNQVEAYNPTTYQYGSNGEMEESQKQNSSSGRADSSEGRSRSLSRNNKEFRELDNGGVPNSQRPTPSPRHKSSDNSTPVSNYSSDIHSNTSRQMSYQGENVLEEQESYEDVSHVSEYEIEYASQSERPSERPNDEMMEHELLEHSQMIEPSEALYDEEEWVDENDHNASNSHSHSTPFSSNTHSNSNTHTNSNSTDNNVHYSGSSSTTDDDNQIPLAYLAHNAQLQQQSQKTSFDSLRNKWEQPYS